MGLLGVLQPFRDGIKLFVKETLVVFKSNSYLFFLCPFLSLMLIIVCWTLIPVFTNVYYINYSVLLLFVFLRLMGYMVILVGWSSNSCYSMIGSVRFISQSISYEVRFILIIYVTMLLGETFSLRDISGWQSYIWNIFILLPIFLVFFIRTLFELNRSPADLVEGESELVSGFNVEYFSGSFALIFLGEYGIIIFISYVMVLVYTGVGLSGRAIVGVMFMVVLIIYMRGVLPRVRYDELMYLCWKIILPLVLNYLFFIFGLKFLFFY